MIYSNHTQFWDLSLDPLNLFLSLKIPLKKFKGFANSHAKDNICRYDYFPADRKQIEIKFQSLAGLNGGHIKNIYH